MPETRPDVLVIGYGNPGRGDDGLGPAAADAIEKMAIDGVDVDADYQLTVEDAAAVAEHGAVLFIDAAVSGPEPFSFERIRPVSASSFSSHSVAPEAVLGLAQDLFSARTPAYILGIRGYTFEPFCETLSDAANDNLRAALEFIEPVLRERSMETAPKTARQVQPCND